MGGFIAATEDGITTTLGRGGSDFTASLAGAGIGAEEIQIWTDVDGMLTADPTVCPDAHRVKMISFTEAAELAYFGAKVLHPATVLPGHRSQYSGADSELAAAPGGGNADCRRRRGQHERSEVHRLQEQGDACSTYDPRACSWRTDSCGGSSRFSIAIETSVDMVATSEVSVSLTMDETERLEGILGDLREFSDVWVDENQAIICMVGENIRHTPGVAARIFKALGGINVRMVSQGASALNLGFVVAGEDLAAAVRRCIASSSANWIRRCSMPNLAIVGYGKMGRLIDQLAPEYGFTVTARVDIDRDEPLEGADVAVEFSMPSSVVANVAKVAALGIPDRGRHHRLAGTSGGSKGDRRQKRLRAGLEPELLGRRERLHAPGC